MTRARSRPRRRTCGTRCGAGLLAAALTAACASLRPTPPPAPAPAPPEQAVEPGAEVYRRADAARVKALELEVERLSADVRAAEETLVAVESGLRGAQTRSEAVSRIAEARIEVERAAMRTPWRAARAAEAREKLDEADRQLAANRVGSAIFFASRAWRMAAVLQDEAERVSKTPGMRFVGVRRLNLRAGPDAASEVLAVLHANLPLFAEGDESEWVLVRTPNGQVGWVHARYLRGR